MFERQIYSTDFGFIDYSYENNLLILHGAFVDKEFRNHGIFKEMLKGLFYSFPEGTKVQTAVKNKNLIPMFEKLRFKRVKKIEYWGSPSNCVLFEGVIKY
jgi:hypothetical protein